MEERRGNWEGKVRKARRESRECVEFRQGMGRQREQDREQVGKMGNNAREEKCGGERR